MSRNIVERFIDVLYGSISIPAYIVLHMTTWHTMSNHLVDYLLACTIYYRRFCSSWILFNCSWVGFSFCFVQYLVMTMFIVGVWCVRYAIDGRFIWNTVLGLCHGIGLYFETVLLFESLLLKFWYTYCSPGRFWIVPVLSLKEICRRRRSYQHEMIWSCAPGARSLYCVVIGSFTYAFLLWYEALLDEL